MLTPGLTIVKTASLASANLGSTVTYTVAVTNSGQTLYPASDFRRLVGCCHRRTPPYGFDAVAMIVCSGCRWVELRRFDADVDWQPGRRSDRDHHLFRHGQFAVRRKSRHEQHRCLDEHGKQLCGRQYR